MEFGERLVHVRLVKAALVLAIEKIVGERAITCPVRDVRSDRIAEHRLSRRKSVLFQFKLFGVGRMSRLMKTFLLPAFLFGGLLIADMPSADAFGGRGAARRATRAVIAHNVIQSAIAPRPVIAVPFVPSPVITYRVPVPVPVVRYAPVTTYHSTRVVVPAPIVYRAPVFIGW